MSDQASARDAVQASGQMSGMSFEDALGELERIVRGLESGQPKLEEAIAAYERGALLRRHCENKLSEVEGRVRVIVERADGLPDAENLP